METDGNVWSRNRWWDISRLVQALRERTLTLPECQAFPCFVAGLGGASWVFLGISQFFAVLVPEASTVTSSTQPEAVAG
jgi:hypothetical protein